MSLNWPTPPSGASNEASFMRRLVDCCKRSVPKAGVGLMAMDSKDGIILTANVGNGAGVPVRVELYKITTLKNDDYFMAKKVDSSGNAAGGEVAIAKSLTGRKPSTETIDTFEIDYTYSDDNNRTADATMLGSEVQVCHPRYQVDDEIFVVTTQGTGVKKNGSALFLYEISPARFWCAAPDGYTPP
jgi:hypothetical protein